MFTEVAEAWQVFLKKGIALEGCRRLESVACMTAGGGGGAWLDALPVASNCLLGDRDDVPSRYMLGLCPAVMQDKPLVCAFEKPFRPWQAMRCRCCGCTVSNDVSIESGWRACFHKSGQRVG